MSGDGQGRCEAPASAKLLRADYAPSAYEIDTVELCFELDRALTRVTSKLTFRRVCADPRPLILDGERLALVAIRLDGRETLPTGFVLGDHHLTIYDLPEQGLLEIVTEVTPGGPGGEGLLWLDGVFITHCEPEGFRRITYFLDRPDVLARYRCALVADRSLCPTLLSNGELLEERDLPDGRRLAVWGDPFPKPAYLFALAAGDFARISSRTTTVDGRIIEINVHACSEDLPFCQTGLATAREAMTWDELVYGRSYDLDVLNIVVVRNYPGGAMENKGLNLFASEMFLASPEISPDDELRKVRSVVAHEYLHNWTGNRVGCRSWFELSLKEGFTIFRQQQFMADQYGADQARIDDVTRLMELQYPEDDGGSAQAIRPRSYVTPNNLYTRTTYEKGAEVVRMLHTMFGDQFADAARAFFDQFDGRAATIDDFLAVVADIAGRDLSQFGAWYDDIGSTRLEMAGRYDPRLRRYHLSFKQTPGSNRRPHHIPVRLALLDCDGDPMPIRSGPGEPRGGGSERLVEIVEGEGEFVFGPVPEPPTPSILRGLSAPVRLTIDLDLADLSRLASRDTDAYVRWDAAQHIAARAILDGAEGEAGALWVEIVRASICDGHAAPGLAGRVLALPSERRIGQQQVRVDVNGIHRQRRALATRVAVELADELRRTAAELGPAAQARQGEEPRRLRNLCLWYLMHDAGPADLATCWVDARAEGPFENRWAAVRRLIDRGGDSRLAVLAETYDLWRAKPVLLDRWFVAQALSDADDALEVATNALGHSDFRLANATRAKLVLDAFTENQHAFHDRSGRGYDAVLGVVRDLNASNPRLAARFLKKFNDWRRYDEARLALLEPRLRRLLEQRDLSADLFELVHQMLTERESDV